MPASTGTAGNADVTTHLPTELIWAVMDYCSLRQLLTLARLSKRWREAALEHHSFRSDIRLYSSTPIAVQLFLGQLKRSRERTIHCFDVRVPKDDLLLSSVIVPALLACLPRIVHLTVWIDSSRARRAFGALSARAPLLQSFNLRISRFAPYEDGTKWRERDETIPPRIFDGFAPHLYTFRGWGVRLPTTPPPAFSKVTNVELASGDHSFHLDMDRQHENALIRHISAMTGAMAFSFGPPTLGNGIHELDNDTLDFCPPLASQSFPKMLSLALRGCSIKIVSSQPRSPVPVVNAKFGLSSIVLDLERETKSSWDSEVLRSMYEGNINFVHIIDAPEHVVEACIKRRTTRDIFIRMLGVRPTTKRVLYFDIIDAASGLTTRIEEDLACYRVPSTALCRTVLTRPDIALRLVEFTITQSLWAYLLVAAEVPALPRVERLTFVIDLTEAETRAAPLCAELDVPSLQHFVVSTAFDNRHVKASDLSAIPPHFLRNAPESLTFWICEGVVVSGEFDALNVAAVHHLPRYDPL